MRFERNAIVHFFQAFPFYAAAHLRLCAFLYKGQNYPPQLCLTVFFSIPGFSEKML